jgi:hypothetical protein
LIRKEKTPASTWINLFLEVLKLDFFRGIEFNLKSFLKILRKKGDSHIELIEEVFNQVYQRIQSGTPTVFIDLDGLQRSPAFELTPLCKELISYIIKCREVEIRDLVIYIKGDIVDLEPLWFTSYGYKILRGLGMGLFTDRSGLLKIEQAFTEMGLDIKLEHSEGFIFKSSFPESLRQRILGFNYLPFSLKEILCFIWENKSEKGVSIQDIITRFKDLETLEVKLRVGDLVANNHIKIISKDYYQHEPFPWIPRFR